MTRFFWRTNTGAARFGVPTSSQSTTLPNGTNTTGTIVVGDLSTFRGTAEDSQSINSAAQTARQSGLYGIFSSFPLAAQTVPAQTWTMFVGNRSGNSRANPYTAAVLYLWDGSSATMIYDSSAQLGSEWSGTTSVESFTASLPSFTASQGDLLVLEVWYTAAQDKSSSYTNTLYWDGFDDFSIGNSNSSPGSYIESTSTISFYYPPAPPTPRTLTAASASATSVLLSWNFDTAANPNPTYTVQQSTDNSTFSTVASGLTGSSYTVTGLTTDTLYYFKIIGTNSEGSATSNTASATPVAWNLENTLEGGTDETSISSSPSLSGPDAFNLFYSNTPAVYDIARAKGGTVSMRTEHTGTTGSSMAGWNFTSDTHLPFYTRFYFYTASLPGSNTIIARIGNSSDSAMENITLNSNGTLSIGNSTTTASISTSSWVRIEAAITSTSSTLRLYNTTESTTVTEEITHSTSYSAVGTIRYGVNAVTSAGPFWWDSLKTGENWLGPESVVVALPLTVYGGGSLSVAGGGILSVKTASDVVQISPPVFTDSTLGTITYGVAFTDYLTVYSKNAVKWNVSGLPDGLSWSVFSTTSDSSTIQITGTPTGRGASYTITASAEFADYVSEAASVTIQGTVQVSKITATGGTQYTSGGIRYHRFTSSGTFTISSGVDDVGIFVVSGGGGGRADGNGAGGGGAGGRRKQDVFRVSPTSWTVTVGGGGASGANGGSSAAGIYSVDGGGAGGALGAVGATGGSGGGSGGGVASPGGSASNPSYGNDGGPGGFFNGGGGGGTSSAGSAGNASPSETGGQGGNGHADLLGGVTYNVGCGGGGGGGSNGGTALGGTTVNGQFGGSGRGFASGGNGSNATGYGSGGGGGYSSGGQGSNGLVIIYYED